jgi:peptidoglycan/LPS O-acetylase OafA/YrhL
LDSNHSTAVNIADLTRASFWPQLQGLRALSVLAVFLTHVDAFPNNSSLWATVFNKIYTAGVFGLDQFFVLSAFLLITRLLRERQKYGSVSFKLYFIRRALRIWPLYYTAVIVGCFILPLMTLKIEWSSYSQLLIKQFLPLSCYVVNFTLPFTQDSLYVYSEQMGIPLIALIVPLWSLSVEEQFYACCPFIARKLTLSRRFFLALAGLTLLSTSLRLVLCAVAEAHKMTHFLWFFNTFARLEPFLVGTAIAAVWCFQPSLIELLRRNAVSLLLANLCLYSALFFIEPLTVHHEVFVIPLVALGCGMTLLLTMIWKPLVQLFSIKPALYLGQLSYSMYMIHKPVLWTLDHALRGHFPAETCWFVKVALGYFITFCLANITYHLIEKTFLKLKARYDRLNNLGVPAAPTGLDTPSLEGTGS